MKVVCFWLLIICLYHFTGVYGSTNSSYEGKLLTDLFRTYNKRVRPVLINSLPVEVEFGAQLSKVIKVDSKSQQLTVSLWITQLWKNPFLSWDKGSNGGITSLQVDPSEIWIPDIGLLNNADETVSVAGGRNKFQTNVIIQHDGTCFWRSPAIFTSDCDIKVRFWPFDTQTCQLKFASFTMTRKALRVQLQKQVKSSKADQFVSSGEWTVEDIRILKRDDLFSCCSTSFSVFGFEIVLKRKPLYFVLNLIIPSAILCLLSLISFMIPTESGERIGFITTILLAMAVYLLLIAEVLPETSQQIPLTGLLFIVAIAENAVILIATIIVLRCFHATGEPPEWLQRWYCCCCPCLGKKPPPKKSYQEKPSKDNLYENEVELNDLDTAPHIPAVFGQNDSREFDNPTWQDISVFLNRLFCILCIILIVASYVVIYLTTTL